MELNNKPSTILPAKEVIILLKAAISLMREHEDSKESKIKNRGDKQRIRYEGDDRAHGADLTLV